MRYSVMIPVLLILVISASGCAFRYAEIPDDFSLTFSWNTGSLPPAYRYDYVISIGPGQQGEFDFVPGYGGESDPNRWITSFEVTEEDLQEIFAYFQDKGFFNTKWKGGIERVGGSTTSLILTAFGKDHRVPSISELDGSEEQKVKDAQTFLRGYVPEPIWEEMDARQKVFESSQLD